MKRRVILDKIDRVKQGDPLRVLDLFSGCGGISLGFERAGFHVAGALDNDEAASKTHAANFHRNSEFHAAHARPKDITKTSPRNLLGSLGVAGSPPNSIDILVGGPPCQTYARIGRSKLRDLEKDSHAYLKDPRGSLYLSYLDYVKKLKPLAILIENVPDVLNYGGRNLSEEICESLNACGYTAAYSLMNAVHYGVPEMRERMFLIAYAKELALDKITFPSPTHYFELPHGYSTARRFALNGSADKEKRFFVSVPKPRQQLKRAVTAHMALSGLPRITAHLEYANQGKRSHRLIRYPQRRRQSEYESLMRNWPRFESKKGITDHWVRDLPRDYGIFEAMEPGDQYPEAKALARRMFLQAVEEAKLAGYRVSEHSQIYHTLSCHILPPYDAGKFPNKWRKMESDQPARTLMAHLGKDSYSHIHYDSSQARTISVREAARLQSFPDGFQFSGAMNAAFKQIGNAVPPLVSYALAKRMKRAIRQSCKNL